MSAAVGETISEADVYNMASRAKPETVRKLILEAVSAKISSARDLIDDLLINKSISGEEVLLQMHKEIENLDLDDKTKLKLVNLIGEYNFRMGEGANEKIQLDALIAQMGLLSGS